jgi:hypothetical protein
VLEKKICSGGRSEEAKLTRPISGALRLARARNPARFGLEREALQYICSFLLIPLNE